MLDNIALGQSTQLSSEHGWNFRSDMAVDGNINTFAQSYGFYQNTDDPWWAVDFGSNRTVNGVALWRRMNCCRMYLF